MVKPLRNLANPLHLLQLNVCNKRGVRGWRKVGCYEMEVVRVASEVLAYGSHRITKFVIVTVIRFGWMELRTLKGLLTGNTFVM